MEGKEVYQCKWLFGIMDKRYHKRHALALAISAVTSLMLLINPALTSPTDRRGHRRAESGAFARLLLAMLAFKVLRECLRYYMVISLGDHVAKHFVQPAQEAL